MENAAKALLIAGGVLLAMMVLAIGVYNYNKISGTADVYAQHFDSIELEKYNSKFTVFTGRKDITAQEIISIAAFANENKAGTNVYVDNINVTYYTETQKKEFLSANPPRYEQSKDGGLVAKNWFSYEMINYDSYGQVKELKFKKN